MTNECIVQEPVTYEQQYVAHKYSDVNQFTLLRNIYFISECEHAILIVIKFAKYL